MTTYNIAYDGVTGKWTAYLPNGQVLTRDTEAEAKMATQKSEWITKVQEIASDFYRTTYKVSAADYEWRTVYSALIEEADLTDMQIIESTHTFGSPWNTLTDSKLASLVLMMEYFHDVFLADYTTETTADGDFVLKTASDSSLDL